MIFLFSGRTAKKGGRYESYGNFRRYGGGNYSDTSEPFKNARGVQTTQRMKN